MHVTGFNFVSFNFRFVSVRLNCQLVSVSLNFRFFVSGISDIDSKLLLAYLSLSYAPWSEGGCLSSAKLRSTDRVNPRAVLSRVRPRYRPLLGVCIYSKHRDRRYWTGASIGTGARSTHGGAGTREEPGTLTQGAPVFPGSSRLGIELQGGCQWCSGRGGRKLQVSA